MERYKRIFPEEVLPNDTFNIKDKKFHVGRADKLIKASEHKLSKVGLNKLTSWFYKIKLNKDYALNLTDEEKIIPGIFVKDNKFNFLIDGWHRAYNLFSSGEKYMNVYIINDPKEIEQITIK